MSLLSDNLKAFLAVATSGTVVAASKEIGLTQTGVTQRLRSLERSLDATLFTRSRRGMRCTEEGEALLRYCHSVRELEGAGLTIFKNAGSGTNVSLTLTGPTSLMEARVSEGVIPVLRQYRHLRLRLIVNDLETRLEDLRRGEAHLAIVPPGLVTREMESKVLKPEAYLLVASSAWRGRAVREIVKQERLVDFDPTDRTSLRYLAHFDLLHHLGEDRIFVNNNTILIKMFQAGNGYGVLTKEVAAPFLKDGTLVVLNQQKSLEEKHALAWYSRPVMPAYFRDFIRAIR